MEKKSTIMSKVYLSIAIALVLLFIWGSGIIDHRIRTSHNDLKAYSEVRSIKTALKFYEQVYGLYPVEMNKRYNGNNAKEYDSLMGLLQGENPQKQRFLDPTDGKDPWKNRYDIFCEQTADNPLGNIFIYSYGKNKIDNKGEKDDICEWKKPTPYKILHLRMFGNDILRIPIN